LKKKEKIKFSKNNFFNWKLYINFFSKILTIIFSKVINFEIIHILIFKILYSDFKKKLIFNFFHILKKYIFKNYIIEKNIWNFFNLFLVFYYVACHMAKVVQSTTATWAKPCQLNDEVGSGIFIKQKKICKDYFQFFFCRDENQNSTKLEGRKSYLSL